MREFNSNNLRFDKVSFSIAPKPWISKLIECFPPIAVPTRIHRPPAAYRCDMADPKLSDLEPLEMESQPTAKALHSMSHQMIISGD